MLAEIEPPATIVALQEVDLQSGALQKESSLTAHFEIQPIQTIAVTQEFGVRISECKIKIQ
jgi:hypothetical protein